MELTSVRVFKYLVGLRIGGVFELTTCVLPTRVFGECGKEKYNVNIMLCARLNVLLLSAVRAGKRPC